MPRAARQLLPLLLLAACHASPAADPTTGNAMAGDQGRLPTGVLLDPVGRTTELGSFPLGMVAAPGGRRLVALLNGAREQGIQVLDAATGAVTQTLPLRAVFVGLAFDPAGRMLYVAGGDRDVVYRFAWAGDSAAAADSIVLAPVEERGHGTRYPTGLAFSPDGSRLYVAENLGDQLAEVEVASGRVVQRLPAGRYPYGVAVGPEGSVYVSAWGDYEVHAFHPSGGRLAPLGEIAVGRHPSAVLLNPEGTRLFVASASTDRIAVVDTRQGGVIATLSDSAPGGPAEGSTPNALALSADGRTLYVAEADNNAVAVFALSGATSGQGGGGTDALLGRIPVEWYPSALVLQGDSLFVANAKGKGTGPNPLGPGPGVASRDPRGYTLRQTTGSLSRIGLAGLDLAALSARVAAANGWHLRGDGAAWPPFEHVIYIIKENRTYDQVFGDLPGADGDTTLLYFGREVTPNHHALAERFGIFDRFFVNAEVSADGHNWSTAAYATDYTEKTLAQNYSGRGRTYDFEGTNRDEKPEDDVAEPAAGYLWDLAQRRGISFRNFGEFVLDEDQREGPVPVWYRGLKPFLETSTDSTFPGFDMHIPDQVRAGRWLAAFAGWEASGRMPALQIVRLPNDHTAGATAGQPTPRAYVADNDLALGRVIEALSRSRFWRSTVVFVLEDDAQNGPDHVDSHRSPLLVISAWNRPHVWHRFTNTTDVLATIESILRLDHLSQFDRYARPLRGIFAAAADTAPYLALTPAVPLDELNPRTGRGAVESSRLDFRIEDLADDDAFNRVLWLAIKGDAPYPGATRLTAAGSRAE